jgi:hypothetical protein
MPSPLASSETRPSDGGNQVAQADVDCAVNLLNHSASPEEVQGKLVERGLDQATASAIVRDLLIQAIYADAAAMLNSGVSPKQAEQQLVDKGVEPQVAKAVIDDLLAHAQLQAQQAGGGGLALQLLGGLIFVVGIGLFIGNVTGVFPTFPFAGFIVMGIGGAIVGAGQRAG